MSRNTGTGSVLEAMILPALTHGHYSYQIGVNIGMRLGGGKHIVDVVAEKDDVSILISLKWQQTPGTAEQKIPFEIMCLMDVLQTATRSFGHCYLVLRGNGWKLRRFYLEGGLSRFLNYSQDLRLVDLESFIAKANKGQL